jgi:hypothetical protein
MQDDLDDGMDWPAGRSIVGPKRACLVGGSYGGYAAGRYRCAASFAGTFNLRKQLSYAGDFLASRFYKENKSIMTPRSPRRASRTNVTSSRTKGTASTARRTSSLSIRQAGDLPRRYNPADLA